MGKHIQYEKQKHTWLALFRGSIVALRGNPLSETISFEKLCFRLCGRPFGESILRSGTLMSLLVNNSFVRVVTNYRNPTCGWGEKTSHSRKIAKLWNQSWAWVVEWLASVVVMSTWQSWVAQSWQSWQSWSCSWQERCLGTKSCF